MRRLKTNNLTLIATVICFLVACTSKSKSPVLFETLTASRTGLDFMNKLTPTDSFNMFTYMYFYNGAGVGAGDFNNDGLIDLFFSSNQQQNKLYINKGNLKFKDVTVDAKIPNDGGGAQVFQLSTLITMDCLIFMFARWQNSNTCMGKINY
jgi:hypothetical protein